MAKTKNPGLPTAEIISLGNELLIGHTLDTNSHWIAKNLNKLGWKLERVTHLGDSLSAISSGVRESLARKPTVLITLGGLGPTYDDMTLIGIARALHKPLRVSREAIQLIKQNYQRLETWPKLTKYRTKMARLPIGSTPLPNPVGTAPGVKIDQSDTTIFSLPGVPSEMKAIFRDSVIPHLRASQRSRPREVQVKIVGIIESALAPILDRAQRSYPGLYFKSHPRGRETGRRRLILLHIYNILPESAQEVKVAARDIMQQLSTLRQE